MTDPDANEAWGFPAADPDADVRSLFVTLITFVASARASHDAKNEALDAIQKLQARLLP